MANFFFSVDSTTFSFPAIEWPSSNYNISFDARSNYFKSPSKTKNSFRKSSSNSLHSSYCALARKPLKQWSQWQLDFFYILELVTVSIEFCLIVTSIQEGVAFFHFFFSIDFFNETPFREFFNSVEQNLCQAHQNSTLDDSVPRCPRNVRKLFSVPYASTFILASASCVKVSAHASEKKNYLSSLSRGDITKFNHVAIVWGESATGHHWFE